jgi:transposase
LMLADGRSYVEIQKRLQTTAPTISRWKKRFLESGIQGVPLRTLRPANW